MNNTDDHQRLRSVQLIREILIYEDNHLIVVNKPFNTPSQDDPSGDTSIFVHVKNYIKVVYSKPGQVYLALLHRLDRPVGGLMVLAKTGKSAARMSKYFKEKEIEKHYLAIVEKKPKPPSGNIKSYLKKLPGKNIVKSYDNPVKGASEAILKYKWVESQADKHLLEIKPLTGRSHQIRVQLSDLGAPITGDLKYGSKNATGDNSICLFAFRLSFEHPVKKEPLHLKALPPARHFWKMFDFGSV